mmetsp:Transcript_17743/g.38532  ORF Transcript_17743/g.38532 Transcript_17743/m.38532 type:complete len:431 (-) Transcript_17743:105-1397(-)
MNAVLAVVVGAVCLGRVSCIPTTTAPKTTPEQIHIAWGQQPSEMSVTWTTEMDAASFVEWGISGGNNYTARANATTSHFTENNPSGKQWVHRALITGLKPNEKYQYRPVTGATVGPAYVFTARNDKPADGLKLLVYGDMGKHGGAPSLKKIEADAASGEFNAVVHVGDFAYDLDSDGGVNGDEFMNRIQSIAAHLPYMAAVGNHEIEGGSFAHYVNRFTMPGDSNGMWYSVDVGQAHLIVYSSETFFTQSKWTTDAQLEWLKSDLAAANKNRAARPWVIAFGHRPMYCSNIDHDDCANGPAGSKVRAGLEELFHVGGVDIVIEAHEHSYERLWPTFNETVTAHNYTDPTAMVHIISGCAGCNEGDGTCMNPMLGPKGPWSAKRGWLFKYGYAHMEVANATHVRWSQKLDYAEHDEDDLWVVQHTHGARTV